MLAGRTVRPDYGVLGGAELVRIRRAAVETVVLPLAELVTSDRAPVAAQLRGHHES